MFEWWFKIRPVQNHWYTFDAWPLCWLGESTYFNAKFSACNSVDCTAHFLDLWEAT